MNMCVHTFAYGYVLSLSLSLSFARAAPSDDYQMYFFNVPAGLPSSDPCKTMSAACAMMVARQRFRCFQATQVHSIGCLC